MTLFVPICSCTTLKHARIYLWNQATRVQTLPFFIAFPYPKTFFWAFSDPQRSGLSEIYPKFWRFWHCQNVKNVRFWTKKKPLWRGIKIKPFFNFEAKLCSVKKIRLNLCPIRQNWQKLAISRGYPEYQGISRSFHFWNSVLKIKFLEKSLVGFVSYMLKAVKTGHSGHSGILESWIPGSRNHNIPSNVHKINTDMLPRLVF